MHDKHNMPYVKVTVTIPPDSFKRLEEIAEKEGRTKSNLIRFLIDNYKKD